jgi:hypothetical protein
MKPLTVSKMFSAWSRVKIVPIRYATHVLSVYHHYRWLAYVNDLQKKGKQPGGFLLETGDWQKAQLNSDAKRELDFWVR